MMKNLLFITIILISSMLSAQDCEVNTNQGPFIDDPAGAYSMQLDGVTINSDESSFSADLDTLTALPHALTGSMFSEYVGIRIPADTSLVYDIGSGPQLFEDVEILSIAITSVEGLPMGFEYACDTPECNWAGGDYGCASLYTTSPVAVGLAGGGIQAYPLNFILSVDANYSLFGIPVPLTDVVVNDLLDYYVLVIEEDNSSNTNDIVDARQFTHLGTIPNPATSNCSIQYGNDDNSIVEFKLYDVLGNLVFANNYQSKIGYNKIDLNLNQFNSGIYTFTLSNDNHNITKRIIVR